MEVKDVERVVASLGPQLLRFARLQLRSDAVAEDAVQSAQLAAIEGAAKFSGEASVKTWVFSILRNKIVDELRRRGREPDAAPLADEDGNLEDALFIVDRHWAEPPSTWADPE